MSFEFKGTANIIYGTGTLDNFGKYKITLFSIAGDDWTVLIPQSVIKSSDSIQASINRRQSHLLLDQYNSFPFLRVIADEVGTPYDFLFTDRKKAQNDLLDYIDSNELFGGDLDRGKEITNQKLMNDKETIEYVQIMRGLAERIVKAYRYEIHVHIDLHSDYWRSFDIDNIEFRDLIRFKGDAKNYMVNVFDSSREIEDRGASFITMSKIDQLCLNLKNRDKVKIINPQNNLEVKGIFIETKDYYLQYKEDRFLQLNKTLRNKLGISKFKILTAKKRTRFKKMFGKVIVEKV